MPVSGSSDCSSLAGQQVVKWDALVKLDAESRPSQAAVDVLQAGGVVRQNVSMDPINSEKSYLPS